MNLKSTFLAATLVLVSIFQLAQAESITKNALGFAQTMRDNAANTVQVALGRVAAAESDLRAAQDASLEARRVNDREAAGVAAEAVAVAKQGLGEAQQFLKRSRALLAYRERTVEQMKLLSQSGRKIDALAVPVEGDVRVLKSDGSHSTAMHGAVLAGERIETGPNGKVRLFVGGGHGEIELKESSSFTVLENDPATGFSSALHSGVARLRALAQHYLGKKFEVRTPSAVTSVRGTEFAVTVLKDGDLIQVFEGVVTVSPSSGGEPADVQAGTQRRYLNGQGLLPAEPLDAANSAGWSGNAANR